ncbi:uncharacterized protein [Temnothorax nylanderi]|uniref:uncharacterized protein n=1 Tax=Temnothorax nylanderi TaxID=102681 RepID=UPI003A8C442F
MSNRECGALEAADTLLESFHKGKLDLEKALDYREKSEEFQKAFETAKQLVQQRLDDLEKQHESQDDPDNPIGVQNIEAGEAMQDFKDLGEKLVQEIDVSEMISNLNADQRRVFDDVINTVTSPDNKQLLKYVSGEGGTGKSFLIKTIKCWIKQNLNKDTVVAAPTGIAAFNIDGLTVHRVWQLLVAHGDTPKYTQLSDHVLKVLRAELKDVHLIIIDEVSMISNLTLAYIHLRLSQIFNTTEDGWFGQKHILLFRDLLQLPPDTDYVEKIKLLLPSGLEYFIERVSVKFQVMDMDKAYVVRKQFPLSLSYGITIHKSQGLSLQNTVIDIDTSLCDANENPRDSADNTSSDEHSDAHRQPPTEGDARSDTSADTQRENSGRGEFSLTSYDSDIFDPAEEDYTLRANTMSQPRAAATIAPREDISPAQINAEIERLRPATNGRPSEIDQRRAHEPARASPGAIDSVLSDIQHMMRDMHDRINRAEAAEFDRSVELLRAMRDMQDRVSRLEAANYNRPDEIGRRVRSQGPLDITYGRTLEDVRNQHDPVNTYLKLKEARDMIPEIDGTSRSQVQKFLNASTYAMNEINPAEEKSLLKAILCTKLTGKAMYDFQTRDIHSFAQLKQEIEMCYLAKRSTTHIQKEFNMLRQKPGESAREYGLRVDKLSMELYQSMIEGREQSSEQRKAILDTIQELALENFQLGLRDDIQTIVRSRNYANLTAAILGATSEEKLKGPPQRSTYNTDRNQNGQEQTRRTQSVGVKCNKCGKLGHSGQECRTSRYANRYSLPRAEKPHGINTVEKYCFHCKKEGHKREDCWTLNGRPEKERTRQAKYDAQEKKPINATEKNRGNRTSETDEDMSNSDSSSSSRSSGNDKQEKRRRHKTRHALEYRVAQVSGKANKNSNLDLVTLPMREATKGKLSFLLDSGAAITFIKVGKLKDKTKIREKKIALTGVTGHQIYTLGKIRASILIGKETIRHTMYVVRDDFPVDYEGILGIDFLKKHQAVPNHAENRLKIGAATFKLQPYRKFTLPPRSETIISAITNTNKVGIVRGKEISPGVFIGNCMVKPIDFLCPISIVNITEKPVEIITPHVTLEEAPVTDKADIFTLQPTEERESITERREQLRRKLRMSHLNNEERKTLEQICEDYCDIFHLEDDKLTCTPTVKHEIPTRADSAPVNVRPYRLPEKHKEEINRQINKMLEDGIIRPIIQV